MAKIQSIEPNIADLANGWLKSYKLDYKLEQESLNAEIDRALEDYYSKNGGVGGNRPDAKLLLQDKNLIHYPILIEYKGYKDKLVKLDNEGRVANKTAKNQPDFKNINSYAVNGAVHYANALLHYTSYTDIIAIGMTGFKNESGNIEHSIGVYYVSKSNFGIGQKVDDYTDLSFLKKENFDKFIEKVKNLQLTQEEIEKLKKVRPHAIITTNYDDLLEKIFDNYQPIVGHNVVTVNYTTYGEIMKIHGSSKEPESIIITNEDYVEFYKRKKYISAKLLTYFVEHPLFFIGYSINDENIKAILSDIDEIIAPNNALIPNIYLVSFSPECEGTGSHQKEILIGVGENKSIRIKVIYANDFGWIYDALSSNTPEISVNPKLVRALLARTYTFASQSLVKQELPYDFEMLKNIAEQDNVLAKLYGIAELNNGQALNASYPYTISELAKLLDMGSWHYVHKVLERIHKETGFNIKSSDNNYHVLVKTGKEGVHKYSPAAFELIKKIINGQKYKLKP